jgi:hypothetical protein
MAEKSGILPKLPSQPIPQAIAVPIVTTQFSDTHPPKVEAAGIEPASRDIDGASLLRA